MEIFLENAVKIAVPIGAMTLDEATLPTRARNTAVSYLPSKPDKYGIRYYMVAGSKYQYIFSFYDNGRGNTSSIPIALRYCSMFPELQRTIREQFNRDSTILIDKATALWCALVLNTTKCVPMSTITTGSKAHRHLYVDNYYTRHVFAEKLHSLTNSEIFTTGTVRYSYVGTDDKKYVDKVLKLLSPDNIPRSSWYLVAVHDHKNPRSKALNCGYIVYKDNKLVIFYTNNLQGTPSKYILKGENVEAVKLVHGLGEILRYDKSKYTVNKKVYLVPNIVVTYNLYMNNVDLVDQRRKATYTQRKERKNYMSFFHFILDYAVNNTYALYRWALDHCSSTNEICMYKDLGKFKKEIGM